MNAGDCKNCPIETADVTRRKGGEEGKRKGRRRGGRKEKREERRRTRKGREMGDGEARSFEHNGCLMERGKRKNGELRKSKWLLSENNAHTCFYHFYGL